MQAFMMTKTKMADQSPSPMVAISRKWHLLRPIGSDGSWAEPQPGQALVEFALILPVLMLIIVGIFEFGLAFFDAGKVDFTTREVARRLAICSNACDVSVKFPDGTSSTKQYDLLDLDAIANLYGGPTNASSIDPALIQYVWIQKTNADGYAIPITGTVGNRSWDENRGGDDFRHTFNYFVYNPGWKSDGSAVPFQPIDDAGCASKDPWVGNNEYNNVVGLHPYNTSFHDCLNWISNLSDGIPGRRVCEPTNSFFVEISYRHFWITPLIPSVDQQITLKSRIKMKVEPLFFTNQFFATNESNPACNNN